MRINRAALENATAFDRKKGGRTMPADAQPGDSYPKRLDHKKQVNEAPGARRPMKYHLPPPPVREAHFINIGGKRIGLELARMAYTAYQGGVPVDAITETYSLTKMEVNAIVMKGRWNRLGRW